MRYILLIPDGAPDQPHQVYGGKTALEIANIPHFHRLAREGRFGQAQTVPNHMSPGSDIANLSLLGYAPDKFYTGRAPLEAASIGITLKDNEAVFRANTVIIEDLIMKDYSGGHITSAESRPMISRFANEVRMVGAMIYPGTSYRHLCVFENMPQIPTRTPPHDITNADVQNHNPVGEHAYRLLELEALSREWFLQDSINQSRKQPITQLWLWGGGTMPHLPQFNDVHGVSGALISAVDLLKGIARLSGLEVIQVEGATGYYDTNFSGKAEAAIQALKNHPFVAIHVEAPDEAGHNGHGNEKIKALENIDSLILKPLLELADRLWGDHR